MHIPLGYSQTLSGKPFDIHQHFHPHIKGNLKIFADYHGEKCATSAKSIKDIFSSISEKFIFIVQKKKMFVIIHLLFFLTYTKSNCYILNFKINSCSCCANSAWLCAVLAICSIAKVESCTLSFICCEFTDELCDNSAKD
ncbi:hypothetical protein N3C_0002 [Clostridium sp. N3C]|nr:hypothetical protein N3C_0002 [Clostridium sp. N3C]